MPIETEALRCPVCDHREVGPVGARCPREGRVLVVDDGPADPLVGRRLDDRFVIVGVLGRGRAGRIYRALALETGREVALRVLRPALARGAGFAPRLAAVVPRLRAVDHPGVVVPFATWTSGNLHCQAAERVPGEPLESLFGADPRRWVLVFAELLAALDAAARHGLWHLHLTPQKVRLVPLPDGGLLPRILDFGLSAIPLSVWQALGVLSPLARRFMAPELASAEGDHRADVYAAGALLWWVMCDGAPDEPDRRQAAPPGLAAVADRACAADPAARFADAGAMRHALLAILRAPEALWRVDAPDAALTGIRVTCTACAWSLHGPGPRFDAALDRLVERLEAQGDLDPGRERVFRRLMARADLLLCETPDRPPHVARVCPACGSTHSVRLTAIGALRHCVTCGFRLGESKIDAVITQREARRDAAVFGPTDGALLVEEGSISARLAAGPLGLPLPRRPAAFHLAGNLTDALRVTVSPRHPPALPVGFVYCAPLDAPPMPDRSPRPVVEPGHVADVDLYGWPPAIEAGEALHYGVIFEGRGARRVLRSFAIRPLPRIRASVVFEGETPREMGEALLTVARGAPFSLTLMADAVLPALEQIELALDGRDARWKVPLELKTIERQQTGVLPRIPAGPALSFAGLVPRDLPVGRDVRVTLTAGFERTLGRMSLVGRWRITAAAASGTELPAPSLDLTLADRPPVALAPDRAALVELLGGAERTVALELRARDLPPGADLELRAEGAAIDERLTCTHREGALSVWRGRLTFGPDGPGPLTVLVGLGRTRLTFPITVVAPPRIEATIVWDARPDAPFVHRLGPDRPLINARPWPGATRATVNLRAIGYPVDAVAIEAPEAAEPAEIGPLRIAPDAHAAVTLELGAELRLRVEGVRGGAPAVYVVRLAQPITDVQPLRLVEGDVVAIERVVAGHVETRVLDLSNALPEPLELAAVEAEGLPWMQIVRAEAAGGGGISSRTPLRLDAAAHTPLVLHIAPPAALPASAEPVEGALVLWVPGLAAPVRLPVGVREIVAVPTLPGPLALDLGAMRVVARLATPDGPQTWRGRLGLDAEGRADPAQGVRGIAHRLARGLGMRPQAIHLVCPTGSPFSERQALAVMLTESFGGVEVDITLDQATASALGALETQIKDDPDHATQELLSVDIGARTTDIARIQAAIAADGRWQVWVRSRAVTRSAGDRFTALLADELLRPEVAEALSALGGDEPKGGGWYNRAAGARRRTGKVGGWYARARSGGKAMNLASAAEHPGDLRVARSDRAVFRLAEAAKRAFGEAPTVRLDALETFAGALDDLLCDTPAGLKALSPEARARLGEVELSRAVYAPIVKAALDELFARIGRLIADGGVQRVVLCGYSVHLPAGLEAAQTAFSAQHLRIVPESLAARGAFWAASGKAGVRWVGEPIDLDD